jgi:hypothetical protein
MLKSSPGQAGRVGTDLGLWRRRALIVLGVLLALRLISLAFNTTELFFDEAQYWSWGKEPAFGYFSKPPLLAWILGAVTAIFGDSEFAVRMASPVLHSLTAYVIFLIGDRLFDPRTGFWSAVTYATLPAVSLSATIISTDVPLLLCWSLAILAFLELERAPTLASGALLGLAIGAGLLAKYAMAYFFLCAAIYALGGPRQPAFWRHGAFWLAVAVALAVIAPNIWWNTQHQFATVSHTGDNIGWDGSLHFRALLEFVGSQFGVFGPILFGMLLVTAFRLITEGMDRSQRFLLCFSLPVLVLILFQAVLSKAYANWAAPAYVAGTVLVADILFNRIPLWWGRWSLGIHTFVFGVIAVSVAYSQPGEHGLPDELSPFARMHGARAIADGIRQQAATAGHRTVLVDNRRLAALMNYYLRGSGFDIRNWREGAVARDHFELTQSFQENPADRVLLATADTNPAQIIASFAGAELLGEVKPAGGVARAVWFYSLSGYRPAAPETDGQ